MDPDKELHYEFPGAVCIYKSGRVERLDGTVSAPATTDPITGVTSKDVAIDAGTGVSARLYLPVGTDPSKKLPILIFIHGGAFMIHTAGSPAYHTYLNSLVAKANVVAVSVTYRLAPEHVVPAAYDDTWTAIKWALANCKSGPEPWLAEHGDPERLFLAGDSAGANIAHNIAVRIAKEGLDSYKKIKGIMLLNPYFWGKDPVGSEMTDPVSRGWMERTWEIICGGAYGIDHHFVNPMRSREESMRLGCERVIVTVAEEDVFWERGRLYVEVLKKSGWEGELELYETKGESHVYFLSKPECEKAAKEMEALVSFIYRE